jgi:hypothetical protein
MQKFKVIIATVKKKEAYDWPGGVGQDGTYYAKGTYYRTITKQIEKQIPLDQTETDKVVIAPWVSPTKQHQLALATLVALADTQVPVVRGDWFFIQTAASVNRKPGYYDFLGIKDQKDFEALVGFDAKVQDKSNRIELRAAVGYSGVTLQPRAIARYPAIDPGGYWKTFDFREASGPHDVLSVFLKDIEKDFDATEQFGFLPNSFWATALFNKAGQRQDTAPDFIASDSLSRTQDRRVHVNVSCIRCHSNAGLKPVDDWVKKLLDPPPGLQFATTDYKKVQQFRQQYLKGLDVKLTNDRAVFDDAVKIATGWDSKTYAAKYGAFWERREDARQGYVDLVWIERDLGVPKTTIVKALDGALKSSALDPTLAVLMKTGMKLSTKAYEARIGILYDTVHAYVTATKP